VRQSRRAGAAKPVLTPVADLLNNPAPEQGTPDTDPSFGTSGMIADVGLDDLLVRLKDSPEERAQVLQGLLGEAACRQLGVYPVPAGFKLSVVIPVFNERQWIHEILRRVRAVPIPKEIILVDDYSTDGTREILRGLEDDGDLRIYYNDVNRGKGAALREGFRHATGDVVIVQDADLEYDPAEYPRLIQPILDNRADVVFGSRFIGDSHRVLYFWHYVANRVLTTLSNMFTNLNLTDMETCYKVFRREVLTDVRLKSNRFGFEPEITAKVARRRTPPWRIYEVPISYSGRTYEEGKKIGLKDAFSALYCIVRYRLFD
jgi:glycosyltransferase involved in cell wall biosynthesis